MTIERNRTVSSSLRCHTDDAPTRTSLMSFFHIRQYVSDAYVTVPSPAVRCVLCFACFVCRVWSEICSAGSGCRLARTSAEGADAGHLLMGGLHGLRRLICDTLHSPAPNKITPHRPHDTHTRHTTHTHDTHTHTTHTRHATLRRGGGVRTFLMEN
jgi:hypothetical protein